MFSSTAGDQASAAHLDGLDLAGRDKFVDRPARNAKQVGRRLDVNRVTLLGRDGIRTAVAPRAVGGDMGVHVRNTAGHRVAKQR